MIHIGLDVGSTTVKVVVMDEKLNTIYTSYQRHFSDTRKTIYEALEKIVEKFRRRRAYNSTNWFWRSFCV